MLKLAFSLTPDPEVDTVLTVPLVGVVGDTPDCPDQIEHAEPVCGVDVSPDTCRATWRMGTLG